LQLDGAAPWLARFAPLLNGSVAPPAELPVRFVPAAALPAGEAYEAFIARTGTVPTRDNLHDAFNRLVWCRHPALKLRLNALQATEIARRGVGATRGPLRDALTLFDENGALWPDAPPVLAAALAARDWHALFVVHRASWRETRFEVFGHALLEQLATAPRKALTAHVALGNPLEWAPEAWAGKPFLPLPVLGIPGWWPANEDPGFYADEAVFRPARLNRGASP
jgi:hypothetical protein